MRILAVADVTGYQVGGVSSAVADLTVGLAAAGHEVGLVNDIPYSGTDGHVRHFAAPIATGAGLAEAVERAVSLLRPDVVHLVAMGQRRLARLLPALRDRPWVLTVHSISPYERILRAFHSSDPLHYAVRRVMSAPNTFGWKLLFRRRLVPHVIVHSEWMRRTILGYGQPDAATTIISLASSKAEAAPVALAPSPGRAGPRLVTIAGFAHTKGLHDAVRAMHILRDRYPNIHYCVAGEARDATYRAYLESLVRRLGLEGAVTFAERLAESSMLEWLQSADVYVQPSHEEGFCLAYLEAARLAGRLVGADSGAIRQIGEGDEAMRTVPPRDPHALAEAIADLLSRTSPDEAALKARRDRLRDRYSIGRYVQGHVALYERLLGDWRPATPGRVGEAA